MLKRRIFLGTAAGCLVMPGVAAAQALESEAVCSLGSASGVPDVDASLNVAHEDITGLPAEWKLQGSPF